MAEVVRKEKEHIGSLLRRFSERVKKSGILADARGAKYFQKKASRSKRREAALAREKIHFQKEMARKIGREE